MLNRKMHISSVERDLSKLKNEIPTGKNRKSKAYKMQVRTTECILSPNVYQLHH